MLYTVCYREFKSQLERWYPGQGKKVVPRDLTLTPLSVAHWLCGDGSGSPKGGLCFYTNGFTKGDVDFLVSRLRIDLGVYSIVAKNARGEHTIQVSRVEQAFSLAEQVRPFIPDCFQYKLRHVRHQLPRPVGKLPPEAVREIRISSVAKTKLASKFDVSVSTIHDIVRRRTYKHVD